MRSASSDRDGLFNLRNAPQRACKRLSRSVRDEPHPDCVTACRAATADTITTSKAQPHRTRDDTRNEIAGRLASVE
jgi:hypothetical protein